MPKIYTKSTWVDEILDGDELYDLTIEGEPIVNVEIALATSVTTPGTELTAARMNNIEEGINALDTKVAAIEGDSGSYIVTSQFDKTSDTVLENIPGLGATLGVGTYKFNFTVVMSDPAKTGQFKLAIGGTLVADKYLLLRRYSVAPFEVGSEVGLVVAFVPITTFLAEEELIGIVGLNAEYIIAHIDGYISVSEPGTLTGMFAQLTSDVNPSSVLVGSSMTINQLP